MEGIETAAPAEASQAPAQPAADPRASELAALRGEDGSDAPKDDKPGIAKTEPKGEPPPKSEEERPVTVTEKVQFRQMRQQFEREAKAREAALKQREDAIAEKEKGADKYLDDPFEAFNSLAKRRNVSLDIVIKELNDRLAKHGTPEATRDRERQEYEARIKALEDRIKDRETKEVDERTRTDRGRLMQEFLGEVNRDIAKYPSLSRFSDTWIAEQAHQLVWGQGAAERLEQLRTALGRDVTNDDIAKALDIRAKAFQRDGTPNRAPGTVESANREGQANGGGGASRVPPSTSNTLAAERPTSSPPMTEEERRDWELSALRG